MATSTDKNRSNDQIQAMADEFARTIEQHAPWGEWASQIASRKKPVALKKLFPNDVRAPLLWSVAPDTSEATVGLLKRLNRMKKDRHQREPADWNSVVDTWLQDRARSDCSVDYALECLAWSHRLSRLAPRVNATTWWELAATLIDVAQEAVSLMMLDPRQDDLNMLHAAQLLTCELPITLGYWFPPLNVFQELCNKGKAALAESIVELLDGEGMLHGRQIRQLPFLLACWTRCIYLGHHCGQGKLAIDAKNQFEWFVRQSLRLLRADGTFALAGDRMSKRHVAELIPAALAIAGDETDYDIFSAMQAKKKDRPRIDHLPLPGDHSEWAEAAILRSSWTSDSSICAVTFCDNQPLIELSVGKRVLIKGFDRFQLKVNGEPAEKREPWEEICWESDDDVDYLEIQTRLEHGLTLQRQFILLREDALLFTADALLGATQARFEYERRLPFLDNIEFIGEDETRELTLRGTHVIGRLLPLALPEWKIDESRGELADDGTLRQTAVGNAMYAPLLIDLNSKRSRRQLTWRQLTVAEKLEIVPDDKAVAYRIQLGKEQWVVYRSLTPSANRTFLGQNRSTEFLFARFTEDGEAETMIEVL